MFSWLALLTLISSACDKELQLCACWYKWLNVKLAMKLADTEDASEGETDKKEKEFTGIKEQ